jgi:predicted acylesterase/phospholipase RssA
MSDTGNQDATFELGLVMAGAISAGAYTAGVIDFLLQALDEWQQLKNNGVECPPHDVTIRVMSGASAGGMTSAITSAMLNGDYSPVDNLFGGVAPPDNPLYNSWVKQIDIKPLLGEADLRDNKPVVSLLDSTILDKIAQQAITFIPPGKTRPYIEENLHLYLTLTNLHGVPYRIAFQGQTEFGHEITMHADNLHFVSGKRDPGIQGAQWLDSTNQESPAWRNLMTAALATGAFPMGLAPRILSRPASDYDKIVWEIPEPQPHQNCIQYVTKNIPPAWPKEFGTNFSYDFICVDGGVMDNNPLELARRNLARGGLANPRSPELVNRSVLMIAPFPADEPVTKADVCRYPTYDIVQTFTGMFSSLIQQARFKPEELVLAQDPNVYSRWMIAPVRYDAQGKRAAYPIASGMLGGFGGFLSEGFRRHDYRLGRRNCQKFLRDTFVIPLEAAKKNPVFKAYEKDDLFTKFKHEVNGLECLQVIPVNQLPESRVDVQELPWEKMSVDDWEDIRTLMGSRLDKVADRLIDVKLERSFLARVLAKGVYFFARNSLKDAITEIVEKDLKKYKLI